MKKRKLKKWVINLLMIIQFMLFIVLCSECDNLLYFTLSKIIAMFLFLINHTILYRYTDLFEE